MKKQIIQRLGSVALAFALVFGVGMIVASTVQVAHAAIITKAKKKVAKKTVKKPAKVAAKKTAKGVKPAKKVSSGSTAKSGSYSMDQVAAANSQSKCWTVISGNVYDLTAWVSKHPGGQENILSICGIDGTSAFEGQHGGQGRPAKILASYKIGTLQ